METINQMASTAMKAVWGEGDTGTHTEPISGATGDVSKGEPYDAGNLDQDDQKRVASSLNGNANGHASGYANGDENNNADSSVKAGTPATTIRPEPQHDLPINDDDKRRDLNVNADSQDEHDQEKKPKPKQKPRLQPEDQEGGDSEPEIEGKGPRPLEVVAKEHGGDAGAKGEPKPATTSGSVPGGDEKKSGESKGTGEQYVTTTGLAADGGDFDATKPGAGREADRLMEEKGMHHEGGDNKKGSRHSHGRDKDKPSLGERIKNKLHKH